MDGWSKILNFPHLSVLGMVSDIWEFTPTANGWVHKSVMLPVPLGFIPNATIGNFIYTDGGTAFDPVTLLIATDNAFRYDPVAESITTLPNIPRVVGETRALTFNNKMYLMGGRQNPAQPIKRGGRL